MSRCCDFGRGRIAECARATYSCDGVSDLLVTSLPRLREHHDAVLVQTRRAPYLRERGGGAYTSTRRRVGVSARYNDGLCGQDCIVSLVVG